MATTEGILNQSLESLKRTILQRYEIFRHRIFEEIAEKGNLDQLRVCYENGFTEFNIIVLNFDKYPLDNLIFLMEKNIIDKTDYKLLISRGVDLESVKLLELVLNNLEPQQRQTGVWKILYNAAKRNILSIFNEYRHQFDIENVFMIVAKSGNFQLYSTFSFEFENLDDLVYCACLGGSLEMLQNLLSRGGRADQDCFDNACEKNNVECVRFLTSIHRYDLQIGLRKACKKNSVVVAKFLESIIEGIIDWKLLLSENVWRKEVSIWISEKLDPVDVFSIVWEKDSSPMYTFESLYEHLSERKINYSLIKPVIKYKAAKEIAKFKTRDIRLKRFGWLWRNKWLIKSADPNGKGVVFKNWLATIPKDYVRN
jgi:hypothetical protein